MIDYEDARRIAQNFIHTMQTNVDPSNIAIIEDATKEEQFGWIFSYNDRRYLETRDTLYALAGNQPLVVLRKTGEALYLPTVPMPSEFVDMTARIEAVKASRNFAARIAYLAKCLATMDATSIARSDGGTTRGCDDAKAGVAS